MMKKFFPLFAISFILFASCANMFQSKVDMPRGGTPGSLYGLLATEIKGGQLAQPGQIFVSLYDYKNTIEISWTPVANAAYYRLERAVVTERNAQGGFDVPDESEFDVLEGTKSLYSTSYKDFIINGVNEYSNEKYGYAYFYRVCAENPNGGYDASEYTVSTMAALLAPPAKVEADMGADENSIQVRWSKVNGATKYVISRAIGKPDPADGDLQDRGVVTPDQNKFTDKVESNYQGKDIYYVVRSVSGSDTSVKSSVAYGYTLIPGAPAIVSDVQVVSGRALPIEDGVSITWKGVSKEGVSYAVYRSSSVDSSLKKIATVSGTTYKDTDTDLKTNVYYYYRVQAQVKEADDTINKGPMSKSGADSESPAEAFILSPPPSITVEKIVGNTSECWINFAAPIGDAAYLNDSKKGANYKYSFIVYGSDSQYGSFTEVQKLSGLSADVGYYKVKIPSKKFYQIKTEYDGKTSKESETVAPAPFAATEVYATKASLVGDYANYKPKNLDVMAQNDFGANSNGVHPVGITWQAPDGGADGGYHIYRSTKQNSGWKKITDEPVKGLSYVDKDDETNVGVIYFYRVLSLNALGQGSNYSVVDVPELDSNGVIITKDSAGNNYGRGFGWGAISIYNYMREHIETTLNSQKKLSKMQEKSDTKRLGSCSGSGAISGTVTYSTSTDSLIGAASGLEIYIHYTNYADYYINNNPAYGKYFYYPTGDTNTKISNVTAQSGNMFGYVPVLGMYPGKVDYRGITISGGGAAGGVYYITRTGIDPDEIAVDWTAGEKEN